MPSFLFLFAGAGNMGGFMVNTKLAKKYEVLQGEKWLQARSRWIRSGIPCRLNRGSDEDKRYMARYTVHVKELAATRIIRGQLGAGAAGYQPDPENGTYADGLLRRLEKAAVRALYTLGVDEGQVCIAVRAGRRHLVEEVRMVACNSPIVRSAKRQDMETKRENQQSPGSAAAISIGLGMDPGLC